MKEKKGEHPFSDSGQLILIIVFLVVWIGDSFFLKKTTFISSYVPLYIRLIISGFIFITAVYLMNSGHTAVEHRKKSGNSVIVTGGFRYVRHLGSILICLGLTIVTLSIASFIIFIGIFIFYNYIAGYEERLLEAEFGEEYREYKRGTGRWMPIIFRGR